MNDPMFHDLSSASVAQRESFSNTVVLLSMVRRESYYITGFSRPRQQIEIAFDLPESLSGLTQTLLLDFSDWKRGLTVTAALAGLPPEYCREECLAAAPAFTCTADAVLYRSSWPADPLLPVSIEKMDCLLRAVKQEVTDFLGDSYRAILREGLRP